MGRRIEFRDDSNLSKVVENYAVTHLPSRLCTAIPTNETSSSDASATSPSTLLFYVDYLRTPRKVRWLDCGASPPKPAEGCNVTDTMHAVTHDICCCRCSTLNEQTDDKRLLIITDSDHGICGLWYRRQQVSVEGEGETDRDGASDESLGSDHRWARSSVHLWYEERMYPSVFSVGRQIWRMCVEEGTEGYGGSQMHSLVSREFVSSCRS